MCQNAVTRVMGGAVEGIAVADTVTAPDMLTLGVKVGAGEGGRDLPVGTGTGVGGNVSKTIRGVGVGSGIGGTAFLVAAVGLVIGLLCVGLGLGVPTKDKPRNKGGTESASMGAVASLRCTIIGQTI